MEIVKHSPTLGIMGLMLWYFAKRNEVKDNRIQEIQNEVVKLVQEVKNEMKEILKTQQSDLLEVIKETQTVIINNTLAVNEMRNTIEKNSQKNIQYWVFYMENMEFLQQKILI